MPPKYMGEVNDKKLRKLVGIIYNDNLFVGYLPPLLIKSFRLFLLASKVNTLATLEE
jgi:hypothetical protein